MPLEGENTGSHNVGNASLTSSRKRSAAFRPREGAHACMWKTSGTLPTPVSLPRMCPHTLRRAEKEEEAAERLAGDHFLRVVDNGGGASDEHRFNARSLGFSGKHIRRGGAPRLTQ